MYWNSGAVKGVWINCYLMSPLWYTYRQLIHSKLKIGRRKLYISKPLIIEWTSWWLSSSALFVPRRVTSLWWQLILAKYRQQPCNLESINAAINLRTMILRWRSHVHGSLILSTSPEILRQFWFARTFQSSVFPSTEEQICVWMANECYLLWIILLRSGERESWNIMLQSLQSTK